MPNSWPGENVEKILTGVCVLGDMSMGKVVKMFGVQAEGTIC
jgi:hypothetical protein